MRILRLITVGMAIILGGELAIAQTNKDFSERPFQDGEILTYIIYYNWGFIWVPAGEVKFEIAEHENHIELDVVGRTFSSYDNIFKVRDCYKSEVDKNTLFPFHFKRDVHEGNYQRFDSIWFDQQNGKLEEYFGKSRQSAVKFEFEVDDKVHDMVSAIYNIRSQRLDSFSGGEQIPVDIFFDKEFFEIDVKFNGIKTKKIKGIGKMKTYHLQPALIDGYVFSEGDVMDIWVSVDDNHIPVMIESPITIGSVKAILSGVKNTKYENSHLPHALID